MNTAQGLIHFNSVFAGGVPSRRPKRYLFEKSRHNDLWHIAFSFSLNYVDCYDDLLELSRQPHRRY